MMKQTHGQQGAIDITHMHVCEKPCVCVWVSESGWVLVNNWPQASVTLTDPVYTDA